MAIFSQVLECFSHNLFLLTMSLLYGKPCLWEWGQQKKEKQRQNEKKEYKGEYDEEERRTQLLHDWCVLGFVKAILQGSIFFKIKVCFPRTRPLPKFETRPKGNKTETGFSLRATSKNALDLWFQFKGNTLHVVELLSGPGLASWRIIIWARLVLKKLCVSTKHYKTGVSAHFWGAVAQSNFKGYFLGQFWLR